MTGRFSRVCFIVNPIAGVRRKNIETVIRRVFSDTDIEVEIHRTEYRGHAALLARTAVDNGWEVVVAVGGDGTLNEVGRVLVDRDTILGLIPLGSGNAFARSLHIPLDVLHACRLLIRGRIQTLDAGKIGDAVFFASAGVGLDAEVSRRYNERPNGRRGFLPYGLLTLSVWRYYNPEKITIMLDDGTDLSVRPIILVVANTAEFGNGAVIAPGARPDDGILDVCIIEGLGFLQGMWHIRRLFNGTLDRMPGVRLLRTRRLHIVRPASGNLHVDGECMQAAPSLEVTVIPQAVRMIVP